MNFLESMTFEKGWKLTPQNGLTIYKECKDLESANKMVAMLNETKAMRARLLLGKPIVCLESIAPDKLPSIDAAVPIAIPTPELKA